MGSTRPRSSGGSDRVIAMAGVQKNYVEVAKQNEYFRQTIVDH